MTLTSNLLMNMNMYDMLRLCLCYEVRYV